MKKKNEKIKANPLKKNDKSHTIKFCKGENFIISRYDYSNHIGCTKI